MSNIIQELENEQMTKEIPEFSPGDTVVVQVKVKEGNRERLQAFEGVVIGKRNRGLNSAFTVRKISHGVGVERRPGHDSRHPLRLYGGHYGRRVALRNGGPNFSQTAHGTWHRVIDS